MEEVYKEYRVKAEEELNSELGEFWQDNQQLSWVPPMNTYFGQTLLMRPWIGGDSYGKGWFVMKAERQIDEFKFHKSWIEEGVELEF